MSAAALLNLVRSGGFQVRRRVLLTTRVLKDDTRLFRTSSTPELSSSRFDPDSSGRPTTWDNFGIWDNRIDEPIQLPSSIKYGKPIPKRKRSGGFQVRRRVLLTTRVLKDDTRLFRTSSTPELSSSRFDPDSSGRPTTWDNFGIWDNRIDEPIQLPSSIKYGKPIPKVNLSKVGCASQIGKRQENEDRFKVAQMTDNILYFAVFDGHGGPAAADFCDKYMESLPSY
ncbi:UNVERIFIED_CONTAM: hypothetical protein FKN15_049993 [Acipenser sinensis]